MNFEKLAINPPWAGKLGRIANRCICCGDDKAVFQISSHPTRCCQCFKAKEQPELVAEYNVLLQKAERDWCQENDFDYQAFKNNDLVECLIRNITDSSVYCWVKIDGSMKILTKFSLKDFDFGDLQAGSWFYLNIKTKQITGAKMFKDYDDEQCFKELQAWDQLSDEALEIGDKEAEEKPKETTYECEVDSVSTEDQGCALIANVVPTDQSGTVFFRIQSWAEDKLHDDFPYKEGQKITIKVSSPS